MNLPTFFATASPILGRLDAYLKNAEQHAANIAALSSQVETLKGANAALTTERDTLNASLAAITAELTDAKTAASDALSAKGAAEAAAAEAKAEAEKLKASPSAAAAAVLASVGHSAVAAGTGGSSAQAETPPANLSGIALAKWHNARGTGFSGAARR